LLNCNEGTVGANDAVCQEAADAITTNYEQVITNAISTELNFLSLTVSSEVLDAYKIGIANGQQILQCRKPFD